MPSCIGCVQLAKTYLHAIKERAVLMLLLFKGGENKIIVVICFVNPQGVNRWPV